MTPGRALLTDLRRRRRSLVGAGRCIQAGRDLPAPLPFDLQGYRLLHLLQARARDDQSAEAARRSLPPRSQHDVHVVVRGVAMFGCEPWSDARRTGIRFQLLHRHVCEAAEVEAAPVLRRQDEGVDGTLAVLALAVLGHHPFLLEPAD